MAGDRGDLGVIVDRIDVDEPDTDAGFIGLTHVEEPGIGVTAAPGPENPGTDGERLDIVTVERSSHSVRIIVERSTDTRFRASHRTAAHGLSRIDREMAGGLSGSPDFIAKSEVGKWSLMLRPENNVSLYSIGTPFGSTSIF